MYSTLCAESWILGRHAATMVLYCTINAYVPVSSINTARFLSPTAFRLSRPIAGHQISGGFAVEVAGFNPSILSFVSVFSRLIACFSKQGVFLQCLLQ